ncbi:ribulose-phosphate 3-epimerase [SAR202 cluster bacterium AC-409-J13_OGT_754m]|nr:ribulose-phosphate 3-epimerase [SAR202 cluster bacterium AC-409-J13_OGT_754m]
MVIKNFKLAPSILSADFSRLGEEVRDVSAAGADYIHLDVMDGRYVPNITFGPVVIESIRPYTNLPLDTHLMISEPERYIEDFSKAGSDILTVHAEASTHLHRTICQIKETGCLAGVAINPTTALSTIENALPYVDLVLILTVNPGFGGQTLIPEVLAKVRDLKSLINEKGYSTQIEVDGGINANTASQVVQSGADILVAGSAIFNKTESIALAVERLRNSVQ